MNSGRPWFRIMALTLGFIFLYLPILLLIIYSFNKSRLVTVWGGFSVKWYDALIHNQAILNAAWLSVRSRQSPRQSRSRSARWRAWR